MAISETAVIAIPT